MGLVHPINIIATVSGRRRCIACLHISQAEPDWRMVQVISRVLTYLKKNPRYVKLDLAYAETISDAEWNRNAEREYSDCLKERKPLPRRWRRIRRRQLNEKLRKLKKDCVEANVPRFPFIHTCLYLGAVSCGWTDDSLRMLQTRPWNAAPDHGGRGMWEPGCTIIDITDHSYAIFLPAHQACGRASKQMYRSLRLRPLDGHEWLMGSGNESDEPDFDRVWIEGEADPAPVTSIEAVREVWPSFPPEPPEADSDIGDEDSQDENPEATDDDEAEIKDEQAEETPAGKIERIPGSKAEEALVLKIEGSPEPVTERSAESQTEQPSGSRKRKREEWQGEQCDWSAIEDLLTSCPPRQLGIRKKHKSFRPLLKRFMDIHPEHFTDKHPGAVPLLLAAFIYPTKSIKELNLHRFRALSGNQVLELVKGAVAHNETVYKRSAKDLKVLDISFNPLLAPHDIARIVDVTALDELIIWNNPGLSQKDVAKVANGRIAKVTTRAGFLAPLRKRASSSCDTEKSLVPFDPPPPMISPTQKIRIRQVMWMMLGTVDVKPSCLQPDLAGQLPIPEGELGLEALNVDTLAVLLHPRCHDTVYDNRDKNKAFAQLVALPCHDAWTPLAEFYTSIGRFEKFMSNKWFINHGYVYTAERWPLAFPLLMATGNEQSEYVVSSAFPTEAFDLTTREMLGGRVAELESLRMRGPYPIMDGEYTLMFLREPDHGRLRLGLVTHPLEGKLTVLDPAVVARAAGDEKAVRAWQRGVGALSPWMGEESVKKEQGRRDRQRRDTMLLDEVAVGKMLAAAAQLSADQEKIVRKMYDVRDAREKQRDNGERGGSRPRAE